MKTSPGCKSVLIVVFAINLSTFNAQPNTLKKYESDQGIVVHEWGTFTTLQNSNGQLLNGLEKEEEHLPPFAYNLTYPYKWQSSYKGYSYGYFQLKNITLKMETPVLYFYSPLNSSSTFSVDVEFKYGTISQWYPQRSGGEFTVAKEVLGPYSNSPPVPAPTIDFKGSRTGSISWKVEVLPKWDQARITNDPKDETPQWIAPRKTESNLLRINNVWWDPATSSQMSQVEKFLFYRGMGYAYLPIHLVFNNNGHLVIRNGGKVNFAYVLVYEKEKNGNTRIWWSGVIEGETTKVIARPSQSIVDPSQENELFIGKLVAAGLYEDEASAMLKTWEKSYFDHEGLKVFWIVPRGYTDDVLPLTITPKPDKINRVLVGRSEILTPEYENELIKMSADEFDTLCSRDRFGLAYKELVLKGIPKTWIDYNGNEEEKSPIANAIPYNELKRIEVYPNPVSSALTVEIHDDVEEEIFLRLYNGQGQLSGFNRVKQGKNTLVMEGLPNGLYTVKVEYANGTYISRKVVKE